MFCELHQLVAKGEALEIGRFRTGAERIGGTEYKPPDAKMLDNIFCGGLLDLGRQRYGRGGRLGEALPEPDAGTERTGNPSFL